jgi:hypothetical protein
MELKIGPGDSGPKSVFRYAMRDLEALKDGNHHFGWMDPPWRDQADHTRTVADTANTPLESATS